MTYTIHDNEGYIFYAYVNEQPNVVHLVIGEESEPGTHQYITIGIEDLMKITSLLRNDLEENERKLKSNG